jgi:hypothetical protein
VVIKRLKQKSSWDFLLRQCGIAFGKLIMPVACESIFNELFLRLHSPGRQGSETASPSVAFALAAALLHRHSISIAA